MRKRGAAARMALCGVLAALAVALMFLGGTVPFASIACPVLASLVLIPVYCECGWKWGLLWYAAVAALAALLAPEKEAAVLFVFFGYYPMLRKLIGRLRVRAAAWVVKLVYVNAAIAEPMRRSATWKPSASVVFRVNISVTPIISTA